ncbi:MAG TPA: FAD-dependent oxidoreductase [Blastocatellia bacterium]|jgi:phytoene dehydrogenase-like protein
MQPNEEKLDAIIIGGGVAGLAAATFLARSRKSARLFEQSHAHGGRARTKQHDGFYLNLGPHALYRGGRGIEVLRELGVEIRGQIPSVSGAYAVKGGIKHTFPAGTVSLLTTSLFGLSAKLETGRLLGSLAKLNGDDVMGVSLREWIDGYVSHAGVREFLLAAFRVATYTNAPELMSAGTAIEQLKLALVKNVLYLDEGWQTIVDGLAEAARQAGALIETGAKVEKVERDQAGAARSVRLTDGRVFYAQNIIIASSPGLAAGLVEHGEQTSLARWAGESIPVKAACLDIALKYLPKPKATFALGIDSPLYLSVHSATARLAPEGCAMIHVAKYLPPDHDDSPGEVERELERLLDVVQPEWRAALLYRRFLPDMIVMNQLPLARLQGTSGRPAPKVSDVPGLFIIGDWVGSEGLLVDASLASAKQAAEMIAARHPVSLAAAR